MEKEGWITHPYVTDLFPGRRAQDLSDGSHAIRDVVQVSSGQFLKL